MNLLRLPGQDAPDPGLVCSRKGCRQAATTRLLWNNPKIHPADRRKTWLACADHVAWLEDYLQSRSLWRATLPLAGESAPGGSPEPGPRDPASSNPMSPGSAQKHSADGEEYQH